MLVAMFVNLKQDKLCTYINNHHTLRLNTPVQFSVIFTVVEMDTFKI